MSEPESTLPSLIHQQLYLLLDETIELPPDQRPTADHVDAIVDWLVGPARHLPTPAAAFDEFSRRMLAAGLPLLRVGAAV
jgi:hypothetical protein